MNVAALLLLGAYLAVGFFFGWVFFAMAFWMRPKALELGLDVRPEWVWLLVPLTVLLWPLLFLGLVPRRLAEFFVRRICRECANNEIAHEHGNDDDPA